MSQQAPSKHPSEGEHGGSIAENSNSPQRKRLWPLVLVSAGLMIAAFPPLDLGLMAWIGLSPLIYAVSHALRPRSGFALAYLFGCIHWGLTVTWIGSTVVAWSDTPLGWAAWVLLVGIKSLWFGLFGYLAWWINERTACILRMAALAACWTVIEWMRGQSGVAMPWSLAGYTQYRFLPVIQAADIGGVYVITFAVAFLNAAIVELFAKRRAGFKRSLSALAAPVSLVLVMIVYGEFRLSAPHGGAPMRVALMQPNVESGRFSREPESRAIDKYRRMAKSVSSQNPTLMIWPESTVERVDEDAESRNAFSEIARTSGAYQIVGTGFVSDSGASHNSAVLFTPDGELRSRYDKHWLVPFGEWIPLRGYLPFGDVFGFPPKDVVPGTSDAVMVAGDAKMSVLICYESVFPVLSRVRTAAGANLLVSITNDSWAGESAELMQHHAMTVLRAVETRRFVVSSATTGITAIIEPSGRASRASPYSEAVLVGDVRFQQSTTVYVQLGDWFVLACGVVVVLSLASRPRKFA